MEIIEIINKKRKNIELNEREIKFIIDGYVKGTICDYQMSALLMAICINGMSTSEINYLTKYMILSGKTIDTKSIGKHVLDKHSTGGVGDKTTLIVVPIVASLGVNVLKMSGRGLGHTGGTADKLESIPGYTINMTEKKFISQIKKIHCGIATQTKDIVPADKKIYALRDVTGTVESIPLIASSIMSKKIASGATDIVIDVKVGKGALIKNIEDAKKLSHIMINIGKYYNRKVICILTDMNTPLGTHIGNSLEVEEAIQVLKGHGEKKLTKLCITLATYMVHLGLEISLNEAKEKVVASLENGNALDKFYELIKYQGGDIDKLPKTKYKYEVYSTINGFLTNIDAYMLGEFCKIIGAGREKLNDTIDYSVGITINKKINDYINTNETLCTIYSNKIIASFENVLTAFEITSKKTKEKDIIIDIIK